MIAWSLFSSIWVFFLAFWTRENLEACMLCQQNPPRMTRASCYCTRNSRMLYVISKYSVKLNKTLIICPLLYKWLLSSSLFLNSKTFQDHSCAKTFMISCKIEEWFKYQIVCNKLTLALEIWWLHDSDDKLTCQNGLCLVREEQHSPETLSRSIFCSFSVLVPSMLLSFSLTRLSSSAEHANLLGHASLTKLET